MKKEIAGQIDRLVEQMQVCCDQRKNLQIDLRALVEERSQLIKLAKEKKAELGGMEQTCLELLMGEKVAQQDKYDVQLQVMQLQLQASVQEVQIKNLKERITGQYQPLQKLDKKKRPDFSKDMQQDNIKDFN